MPQTPPLSIALALAPALPHERSLAFGVENLRPSLHLQHSLRSGSERVVCCIDRLNPQPGADVDGFKLAGKAATARR
jgi:hypothetical protein